MKKKIAIVFTVIFTVLEIALIYAMNYLNSLAYKKAGVNHHLIYKKGEYTFKYLNERNIKIISVVVLIIAVVYVVAILKNYKKINKITLITFIEALLWCIFLEYGLHSQAVAEKLVYPYLILAIVICLLLSTINIIINRKILEK